MKATAAATLITLFSYSFLQGTVSKAEVAELFSDAQGLGDSQAQTESQFRVTPNEGGGRPLNMSFMTIFYGPSLAHPSRSQPNLNGDPDPERPVSLRNFLNLTYNFSDQWALTGTAYWSFQPFLDQKLQLQDPFIRLSKLSLFREGPFNLYADLRVHFGMSPTSRQMDQYFGVQTVEVATYELPETGLTFGAYGALRGNVFGKHGYGYDAEIYVAPNISYQISPVLLGTLLYEARWMHFFGTKFGKLTLGDTDLQPGVTWTVTPEIMINPYLTLLTGGRVNLSTTTFGVLANWNFY